MGWKLSGGEALQGGEDLVGGSCGVSSGRSRKAFHMSGGAALQGGEDDLTAGHLKGGSLAGGGLQGGQDLEGGGGKKKRKHNVKGAKKTRKSPARHTPWIAHVFATWENMKKHHPSATYGNAMTAASLTWPKN